MKPEPVLGLDDLKVLWALLLLSQNDAVSDWDTPVLLLEGLLALLTSPGAEPSCNHSLETSVIMSGNGVIGLETRMGLSSRPLVLPSGLSFFESHNIYCRTHTMQGLQGVMVLLRFTQEGLYVFPCFFSSPRNTCSFYSHEM